MFFLSFSNIDTRSIAFEQSRIPPHDVVNAVTCTYNLAAFCQRLREKYMEFLAMMYVESPTAQPAKVQLMDAAREVWDGEEHSTCSDALRTYTCAEMEGQKQLITTASAPRIVEQEAEASEQDGRRRSMDINIARLDLVSIQLAVLCAELGSVSAASKRVHCTRSTSSYRLSALEETLGGRLFTRDHRGLRATNLGELFVQHGREILQQVAQLSRQVTLVARESRGCEFSQHSE